MENLGKMFRKTRKIWENMQIICRKLATEQKLARRIENLTRTSKKQKNLQKALRKTGKIKKNWK